MIVITNKYVPTSSTLAYDDAPLLCTTRPGLLCVVVKRNRWFWIRKPPPPASGIFLDTLTPRCRHACPPRTGRDGAVNSAYIDPVVCGGDGDVMRTRRSSGAGRRSVAALARGERRGGGGNGGLRTDDRLFGVAKQYHIRTARATVAQHRTLAHSRLTRVHRRRRPSRQRSYAAQATQVCPHSLPPTVPRPRRTYTAITRCLLLGVYFGDDFFFSAESGETTFG